MAKTAKPRLTKVKKEYKRVRITLEIAYDPMEEDHPKDWFWHSILGIPCDHVDVLVATA